MEVKKVIEVIGYQDRNKLPTCAIDFRTQEFCQFYRTRRFGTVETCQFADG